MLDVIIVGGGPAGLSAALMLGRCRRRTLVCNTGQPRNACARALHAFLSRDGVTPAELLQIGREQLRGYSSVELREIEVTDVRRLNDGFEVRLANGEGVTTRKLLLATGVVDELPKTEGLESLYGRSVFHCPYCDAWEVRDQPLAVMGKGKPALELALELTAWSGDLVVCSDGPADLSTSAVERLHRQNIRLREQPVVRLQGRLGQLERILFSDGSVLARRALFLAIGQRQRSALPARLGCTFTPAGTVQTTEHESTNVPGLYVAGDASHRAQLAIVAAAEGAQAGAAINTALLREDLA